MKVRLEDVELRGKRVFWGPRFAKAVKVDHTEKGCWAESVQVPVESSRVESSRVFCTHSARQQVVEFSLAENPQSREWLKHRNRQLM